MYVMCVRRVVVISHTSRTCNFRYKFYQIASLQLCYLNVIYVFPVTIIFIAYDDWSAGLSLTVRAYENQLAAVHVIFIVKTRTSIGAVKQTHTTNDA